jgi:hypothetical protein
MELTPAQREQIQRLLEEELRDAVRAALEGTDAKTVGESLADRRRALEESIRESSQDVQDVVDQRGEGDGIAEQR